MAKRTDDGGGAIVIKKYANRRLYNTGTSSYITLEDIAQMVRDETDFVVLDAKTGEDITHQILTQIILDQESSGKAQMLPVSFLRDLIGMYGNSMQSMIPGYLEASMASFRKNRAELAEAWSKGLVGNPFARIAETNIAMMRAAAEAFMPGGKTSEPPPAKGDDLSVLREQMAEMQKKLDQLSK